MAGKIKVNIDLCKGCGYCIKACPVKILEFSDDTNAHSYHYVKVTDMNKCTGCAACAIICPDLAIEVWRDKK